MPPIAISHFSISAAPSNDKMDVSPSSNQTEKTPLPLSSATAMPCNLPAFASSRARSSSSMMSLLGFTPIGLMSAIGFRLCDLCLHGFPLHLVVRILAKHILILAAQVFVKVHALLYFGFFLPYMSHLNVVDGIDPALLAQTGLMGGVDRTPVDAF